MSKTRKWQPEIVRVKRHKKKSYKATFTQEKKNAYIAKNRGRD